MGRRRKALAVCVERLPRRSGQGVVEQAGLQISHRGALGAGEGDVGEEWVTGQRSITEAMPS